MMKGSSKKVKEEEQRMLTKQERHHDERFQHKHNRTGAEKTRVIPAQSEGTMMREPKHTHKHKAEGHKQQKPVTEMTPKNKLQEHNMRRH